MKKSVLPNRNKELKQHSVAQAILEIVERDGLSAITHSKVSRKSRVSRAWLYEYIGKDKKQLIEFAADAIAAYFARVKVTPAKSRRDFENQIKEGVQFLLQVSSENPVFIKIYFRFRGADNPIGMIIQKYEKQWLSNASRSAMEYLGISKEESLLLAEAVLILRLGFAHRVASSKNSLEVKGAAEKVFATLHGFFNV